MSGCVFILYREQKSVERVAFFFYGRIFFFIDERRQLNRPRRFCNSAARCLCYFQIERKLLLVRSLNCARFIESEENLHKVNLSRSTLGTTPQERHLVLGIVTCMGGGGAFNVACYFRCSFERADPFVGLSIAGLDEETLEIVILGAEDVHCGVKTNKH